MATGLLPLNFYGRGSSLCGHQLPKKVIDVVVVPGNPGLVHFYRPFVDFLFEKLNKGAFDCNVNVYVISNVGRDTACEPQASVQISENVRISVQEQSDWNGDKLSLLDELVLQKLAFIDTKLDPESTLVLIGHSVGCYILLKMLPHIDKQRLGKAIFLFPTMHRIAATPNAQWQRPFYTKYRWVPVFLAKILSYVPQFCLSTILKLYIRWIRTPSRYGQWIIEGIQAMCDSDTVDSIFSLAECEMLQIGEFNQYSHQTILDLVDRCIYYYGASDNWVLEESIQYFCKQFPDAQVHRCGHGFRHAFVLSSSEEVAEMVLEWVDDLLHE
jgi:xanthine dehydrogenase/oxidase